MFLDLDKKDKNAIAVKDDSGLTIRYGDILDFAERIKEYLPERTLIFILSENQIGSLLGYTSCLINQIVPLIINSNTDKKLYENLTNIYKPKYLWIPTTLVDNFGYEVVFSDFSYSLVTTGLEPITMYNELALLLPTSGSTGSPKLVRHSYKNIEANARNVSNLFELTNKERAMAILPMHYTMGLSVVSSHLFAGAVLLLSGKSLLDKEFWSMLKEEKATSFTGVPYSFEILAKLRFFRMDFPNLKIITQGGGKLSEELFVAFANYAKEKNKKFIATYGQTECTARMAYLPHNLASEKICSIGIAEPGGKLSIIDDNGKETFEGEAIGEMVYRGDNVTLGYALCEEDLVKGDENQGVMHTGDIAKRDSDGCYFIVGRKKRFLKIFGLRIGLDEVEHLIKSNFDTDCYCSGNDEKLIINITNTAISDKIISFVEDKTHLFHKRIEVNVVCSISRNEAGKVILNNYK